MEEHHGHLLQRRPSALSEGHGLFAGEQRLHCVQGFHQPHLVPGRTQLPQQLLIHHPRLLFIDVATVVAGVLDVVAGVIDVATVVAVVFMAGC